MNNRTSIIVKDAFIYLLVLAVLTVALFLVFWPLAVITGLLFLFVVFFFRNPPRKIDFNEETALSPADGVVMNVEKIQENRFLNGEEMWKVTIFLSLFNVHLNRFPVAGTVEKIEYVEGKFFPAFKSHAGTDNERNYLLLKGKYGHYIIAQITGFIARRIVCFVKPGDHLTQGERFGLIKFGSCTELYLPVQYDIMVKNGDKVRGGLTIIGRI